MHNDKDNSINPDTDIHLGFLSMLMNPNTTAWDQLEECVVGYDEETPIFDDHKVKQLLERCGKEFRPYFEEMKKVVNDNKTECNYAQRSNSVQGTI